MLLRHLESQFRFQKPFQFLTCTPRFTVWFSPVTCHQIIIGRGRRLGFRRLAITRPRARLLRRYCARCAHRTGRALPTTAQHSAALVPPLAAHTPPRPPPGAVAEVSPKRQPRPRNPLHACSLPLLPGHSVSRNTFCVSQRSFFGYHICITKNFLCINQAIA